MNGSSPIIETIIFFFLLMFTFIVYGYSSAIQSISDNDLESIKEKNNKVFEKINTIIEKPDKFINTVQALSMFMTLFAGTTELRFFINSAKRWSINIADGNNVNQRVIYLISYVLIAFVLIFIILSIGILLPKRIATKYNYGFAGKLTGIVYGIMIILTPVTFIVSLFTSVLVKIFGVRPEDSEENVTEEDIISVINEGHEQGVLLESEAEMINNIVEFGDKEAKDIMTHRTGIVAVDGELILNKAVEYILHQNNSRFPVYIDNIDNIIGIVNFRDIMTEYSKGKNNGVMVKDIEGLVRRATFIPETRNINKLFKNMQSEKIHMAIVVDEYGQTSGIIAMEDILEEIVGNILDEYDEEEVGIVRKDDGSYIVNGMTELEDITEEIGIEYDENECETINGYLTTKFERILGNDERPQIIVDGIIYKILNVQNKLISSVQIILPEPEINKKTNDTEDTVSGK